MRFQWFLLPSKFHGRNASSSSDNFFLDESSSTHWIRDDTIVSLSNACGSTELCQILPSQSKIVLHDKYSTVKTPSGNHQTARLRQAIFLKQVLLKGG